VGHLKRFLLVLSTLVLINAVDMFSQSAGPDLYRACNSVNLQAVDPAPLVGTWFSPTPGVTIANINDPNTLVTNLQPGLNEFEWTVDGNTDVMTVYYFIADAGTDQTVCGDYTLQGNNPSPLSGLWTSSDPGVTFDDPTSPTATVSNLPMSGVGVTFTWTIGVPGCQNSDNVTITNLQPDDTDAGINSTTCTNNSFNLSASDPARFGGTGEWSVLSGAGTFSNVNDWNATVSSLAPGNNVLQWTEYNGPCSATATVTIYNGTVIAIVTNQTVCTDYAVLNGNLPTGASGEWTIESSTATIDDPFDRNSLVNGLNPGNNTFRWTLTNGTCSNHAISTITYNPLVADGGPNQIICGGTTTMDATPVLPGQTGTWVLQGGSGTIADPTDPQTEITGMTGLAPNIFAWVVSQVGCSPVESLVTITVDSLPVDAGPDQLNICTDEVNLNALTGDPSVWGGTGTWSTATTAIIANPNNFNTTASNLPAESSVFRWTVKKGSCEVYDEVTITRSTYFVSAGPDQVVCGTSATLSGSTPAPGATGTWSIVAGGPADISNVNNPTATVSNIQGFPLTLRWTVAGGPAGSCNGSDDVILSFTDMTQAEIIGGDVMVDCGDDFLNGLTALNGPDLGAGETSTWTQVSGSNIIFSAPNNSQTTDLSNLNLPGVHTVRYTITDGVCVSTDQITVTTYANVAVADAGPNINAGCQEWVTMNATAVTPPNVGTWTAVGANSGNVVIESPNSPTSRVKTYNPSSPDHETTYTLRWTVVNGTCSTSDDVVVTNKATAFAAITSGVSGYQVGDKHIYICDAANVGLLGNPEVNCSAGTGCGGWEVPSANAAVFAFSGGGGNPGCVNGAGDEQHKDAAASVNITGVVGSFAIVWHYCSSNPGSCHSTDTLYFHVLLNMENCVAVRAQSGDFYYTAACQKTNFAGERRDICGTSTQLAAKDPATDGIPGTYGMWSGPASVTFADVYDPNTTVFGLGPNANYLTWTVSNDCSSVSQDVLIWNWGSDETAAGEDQIICEDYTYMNANPLEPGDTGEWTVYQGGGIIDDPSAPDTYVHSLLPGENIFRWRVITPFCDADSYVTIYSNKPEQPNAGPDIDVCASGMLFAQAPLEPGVTASWSVVSGGASISDINDPQAIVTPILSPTTLRWTIFKIAPNGLQCTAHDDVVVTNYQPKKAFAGIDQTVCDFATMTANAATPPEYGQWSFIQGSATFTDPTHHNTTVTNLSYTEPNLLVWTLFNDRPGGLTSCFSTDTVEIISNKVFVDAGPDILNLCADSVKLNANNPTHGTGAWSVTSGNATFQNVNSNGSWAYNLLRGENILRWTITYNGCPSYDEVSIWNMLPSTPDAGLPQTVCGTAILAAIPNPTNPLTVGTGQWSVLSGAGTFSDPTSNTSTVTGLNYGPNVLQWAMTNGLCSLTDTVIITSDVVASDAGPDLTICQNFYTMLGNDPAPGTGQWIPQGTGATIADEFDRNTQVTNLNQGTNTFSWVITNNACSTSSNVIITNNTPTTANAGGDVTVCQNSVNLNGNIPIVGTGHWETLIPGITFSNSNSPNAIASNLPQGYTTFRWIIQNGTCVSEDPVVVRYIGNLANAGVNDTICTNSYTLNAVDPAPDGVGLWTVFSGSGNFVNPTLHNTQVTNINSVENAYIWTVSADGCIFRDTVVVVNYMPSPANAGLDRTVCENFTNLNASSPFVGAGQWTNWPVGVNVVNTALPNTGVTNLQPGGNTFTWTVTNNNCSTSDDVLIIYGVEGLNAGPDDEVCGSTYNLNADDPAPGLGEWSVHLGGGTFDNTTLHNTTVTNLVQGLNIFLWTVESAAGCPSTDTLRIWNNQPDIANAGPDQHLCESHTYMEATVVNFGTGYWTSVGAPPIVIDNSTLFNTYVYDLAQGMNVFTWTTIQGNCSSTDNVIIYNDSVSVADAGIDQYVCNGTAIICGNAPAFGTGVWDLVQGQGTILNSTATCTEVTGLGRGRNVFRWRVEGPTGCDSYDYVNVYNLPVLADAGLDQEICTDWAVLSGNNPVNEFIPDNFPAWGYWEQIPPSAPGVIVNSTLFNTVVEGLDWDNNIFRWTVTNGYCSAWDEVNIINNTPSPADAGPDTIVCSTDFILMGNDPLTTPPGRGTGFWRLVAGGFLR
jgi:hypothetical protein